MKRPALRLWFWLPRSVLTLLWIGYLYLIVQGDFAFAGFWAAR